MNQERLNRLWLASGGTEIEALRVRPYIDIDGLSVTVVYRSAILQTMLIRNRSGAKLGAFGNPNPDTFVRKRDLGCLKWGDWLSCSGEGLG